MIVSILAAAILFLTVYVASHRLTGGQFVLALLVGAGGLGLVIFPNFASYAAQRVGVGRGTDLLLYLTIVFGLFVTANYYFRFKRQEQQLVAVVRAMALLEAERLE